MTMKNLLKKNPRLSLKYDISTSLFSKSEDSEPVLTKAEKGDFSIDLRRCLLIVGLVSLFSLLLKLRRLCRKHRRK